MLQKTSLAAVMISMALAACGGGGGSDTAVSANPDAPAPSPDPSPGPAPAPSPGLDPTPISAPSPAPGKLPAPLPPPAPAPVGLQYSGTVLRQALQQSIAPIGSTGGAPETGQYVHDGLENPLAGYIASDGNVIRTRTLSVDGAGYSASREAAVTLTESNGSLQPTVDGVQYTAVDPIFNYASNYPANQTAGMWVQSAGSPYFVKLIPSTLDTHPGVLRLCWHINTAAATRLACTHHRADGGVFGSDIIEDINGPVTHFSWQWEATPRADGQAYSLADYAPGAIAGFPARNMTCTSRTFGPGAPAPETSVKNVSMTPSEIRVDDQVLLRHGTEQTTVQPGDGVVTYAHKDTNPAALNRSYTLRAEGLLNVTWGAQRGTSGFSTECVL